MENKEMIVRTFAGKIRSVNEKDYTVEALVSDESIDRYREVIKVDAWKKGLQHYKKHPVLLSSHKYDDLRKQIGEAVKIRTTDEGLVAVFKYYVGEGNEEADWAFRLAQKGRAAYSVGFIPLKWEDLPEDGKKGEQPRRIYTEVELLEISQVLVPANRNALQRALQEGEPEEAWVAEAIEEDELEDAETKGAIPYKKTPLAPEDTPWNGPKEVAKATIDDLKVMCAWVDPEHADVKYGYKLPHHRAENHYCVWRGVRAAMAALFGARGGVRIPQKDRKPVYNHLAKHYKDFGKEPPEFREYTEEELRELFPEVYEHDEMVELVAEMAAAMEKVLSHVKGMSDAIHDLKLSLERQADADADQEEGEERSYIEQILSELDEIKNSLKEV